MAQQCGGNGCGAAANGAWQGAPAGAAQSQAIVAQGVLPQGVPAADAAAQGPKDFILGVDMFEKGPLLKRVWETLSGNYNMKLKWCAFCDVHGPGGYTPASMDEAFLMTFLDCAFGEGIPPFAGNLPRELQEPSDLMSKGGGKGDPSKDAGRIFVGALKKDAVSQEGLAAMLSIYGTVTSIQIKYADDGTCRGFAFATFEDPASVQLAVAAAEAGTAILDGKRVNIKPIEDKGGGKGDK
eukprot:CAMPEP_0198494742 /NCGR_PEP_ID=MMETSP1462-20131121/4793_1 /TAXON_ID=1333877 /ORGANISM="Brandtodinium nutriculum, Strain RCC3387" /LENGTH=238 /DNA_ID=CAMNT_0044223487 /DNA_START=91 /DNA_END=804 /DNA_ORIENTATION=-